MKNNKENPKGRNIRPKRHRNQPMLTDREIEKVNKRDTERIKELERQKAWQIQEFGYYDPGAADY